MKKKKILIVLASIVLLAGCAPTFPIHALKKGEWGGSVSGSYGHTAGINGCLGYGLSDNTTVYTAVCNLINYKFGLYYAITRAKGFIPEVGLNGYAGIGGYFWIYESMPDNKPVPFSNLQGVLYGGIGIQSIWQVDSSGSLLYVVANNYYQPSVGYAFRPSSGVAFPVTAGGTLFQIDVQTPFISLVTENRWQPLKEHFLIGMGLTF